MANALIKMGLIAVCLAGASVVAPAISGDFAEGNYVVPGSKAAELTSCVRETGFMRRNHMELIEHQRDATVHQGIRGTPESLAGCVACHVSYDQQQQPVSVYSEGQFCRTCHEFTAVDLTCFGCHAAVPRSPASQALGEGQVHGAIEQGRVDGAVAASSGGSSGIELAGNVRKAEPEVSD